MGKFFGLECRPRRQGMATLEVALDLHLRQLEHFGQAQDHGEDYPEALCKLVGASGGTLL